MALSHSTLPRMGSPKPRGQIKTAFEAQTYAAAGFHVCVDEANKEPSGSTKYRAWEQAAALYVTAFTIATSALGMPSLLGNALVKLEEADLAADKARRTSGTSPPKPGVDLSPSAPPVPGQIGPSFLSSLTSVQLAGFPAWAVVGAFALVLVLRKKKGRRRRR